MPARLRWGSAALQPILRCGCGSGLLPGRFARSCFVACVPAALPKVPVPCGWVARSLFQNTSLFIEVAAELNTQALERKHCPKGVSTGFQSGQASPTGGLKLDPFVQF